jgi:hypothetical protein
VVGHLENVHCGQPAARDGRIDVLLHVAREQESPAVEVPKEHDRGVVGLPVLGCARIRRERPGHTVVRPDDPDGRIVEQDRVARSERLDGDPAAGKLVSPGQIGRAVSTPSRLEGAIDPEPPDDGHETGHVVVVRVSQHDCIQASIPGRDVAIQARDQATRIGAAIDEDPPAPVAFQEYGVTLADIEDDDVERAVRPGGQARSGHRRQ